MLDNFEKKKKKRFVPYPKGRQLDDNSLQEVKALISNLPLSRDLLIEYFHLIQDKFRCIRKKHLAAVSDLLKIPFAESFEVATFYAHFDVIEDDGQIEPDEPLMAESLKDEIRQSLDTLKDREKQVIKMYFGIDRDYALTLNEIGEEFSLTRERVRQIKEKAIRRLRHRSRSKSLRTYLG